jgi:hypothetical protein
MKRLIVAATVVLSTAAFADGGKPFEQLDLDRALPQIEFAAVESRVADSRAPFEQVTIDRALPNLPAKAVQYAEIPGSTRSDASSAPAESPSPAKSPWANDHNFIAPPQ